MTRKLKEGPARSRGRAPYRRPGGRRLGPADIGALSKFGYAVITSVCRASPGNCAAAGRYSTSTYNPDGSGPGQAFVLNKTNGTWGTPHVVTATLGNDGPAQISAVACPAAGRCSAAGYYYSGTQQSGSSSAKASAPTPRSGVKRSSRPQRVPSGGSPLRSARPRPPGHQEQVPHLTPNCPPPKER